MINKILQAKHWQIFFSLFGIHIIIRLLDKIEFWDENPIFLTLLGYLELLGIGLSLITIVGWALGTGIGLQNFIRDDLKMDIYKFIFSMIIPVIYFFFVFTILLPPDIILENSPILGVWIVLHIATMVALIYIPYFLSKSIKMAETNEKVFLGEYIKFIFMIFFFPIGIWFLQPEINRVSSKDKKVARAKEINSDLLLDDDL